MSEHNIKAVCEALGTNLQQHDLDSLINIYEETPVVPHQTSETNGKTTDEVAASDTGKDLEDNSDDSCEVKVP